MNQITYFTAGTIILGKYIVGKSITSERDAINNLKVKVDKFVNSREGKIYMIKNKIQAK